ncbi:MAG: SUMF1/EgtB/PvdO family nonheme iron enzyme [bacterium]|nr:SUMF1/EgtB/PvdO family nonheme iron enzyme [Myxococcales bacterium]MCB9542960.1 SUMF1/EgtB/PvdO family nonheme iron enzyme [Myxococcales bacterium]
MHTARLLIRAGLSAGLLLTLVGCDDGGGSGGDPTMLGDMGPDAAGVVCDESQRRAQGVEGPLRCAGEPVFTEIESAGRRYHIFTYEASHPLADGDAAFPCARSQGPTLEAFDVETEACSVAGVRPWHSVTWSDARDACRAIGWQLCTGDELMRACGGSRSWRYPYGDAFETGRCNVREAFLPAGAEFATEAPTGQFPNCVSEDGIFDLTGNLWEWTGDGGSFNDPDARVYQGAGWRTVAERHRDTDLVCDAQSALTGFSAPSFASNTVGFRCCRDAP